MSYDDEIQKLADNIRQSLRNEFDRNLGVEVEDGEIVIQPDYIYTEEMHVLRADIRDAFGWQFDFTVIEREGGENRLRVRPLDDEDWTELRDSRIEEVESEISEVWTDGEVIERAREVLDIVRRSRVEFGQIRRWDIVDRCIRLGDYRGRDEAEIVRDAIQEFDTEGVIEDVSIERLQDSRKAINKDWYVVDLMVADGGVLDTLG